MAPGAIRLTLCADPDSVRAALLRIGAELAGAGIAEDDAATAELVLAEILNNVVEHAVYGCAEAWVEVTIAPVGADLACEVRDNGRPMPGGLLPSGLPPACDRAPGALPEGGFGWFLIRTLARDLAYAREGGVYLLGLRIPLGPRSEAGLPTRSAESCRCHEVAAFPPNRGPESV